MIHDPPLLILDEPTVGTDPVLRRNIWYHLLSLSKSGHTIIVTTHYIEEARNANTVAFMRDGILLAEDDPKLLLQRYGSTNLEDVFLELCDLSGGQPIENNLDKYQIQDVYPKSEQILDANNKSVSVNTSSFVDKCSALLLKSYRRLTRNKTHLLFQLLVPSLLVMVMIVSTGRGPSNLNLAIFDEELQNNVSDSFGQLFVESLDKNVFNVYNYKTFEEAVDSVKSGENHAVIEITDRFTNALRLRFLYCSDADEVIIEDSKIYVSMDRSNQMIGFQIQAYLYKAVLLFLERAANKSGINPESLQIPLDFEEVIYGNTEDSIREFIIPGITLACTFYVSMLIMAQTVYEERRDGLFERNIVAGIKAPEFLISYLSTQMIIICIQTIILLFMPYIILGRLLTGPIYAFITLTISQGLGGAAFGLLLALLSDDIIQITLIVIFFFICAMGTTGVVWPVENMPRIMQLMCKFFPNTIPVQSMRAIIYREWTIDFFEVYMGFVVSYVWIAIFLIMSFTFLKKCF